MTRFIVILKIMWIFMRDSFISIAQYDEEPRLLQVRSRYRGDIEHLFPESSVAEDVRGDYRFRAVIARDRVAHVMALRVQQMDYLSLNAEVRNNERAPAYDLVYDVMLQEQTARYDSELDLPGFVQTYDLEADPEALTPVAAGPEIADE